MKNAKRKNFCTAFNISSPRMLASFVKPSFERPKVRSVQIDKKIEHDSMIHVCFALYDKTGTYSRFTGTAMLSLFENSSTPPPSTCVHLLHDNTLTDDNREKLIQIADRYGQPLKFYNVEELCADKLAEIKEYFPKAKESFFSIAAFYRLFIPDLLLPQSIDKAIYLDSDTIVNLDISELWQVYLGYKPFGAVSEFYQMKDEEAFVNRQKKHISICREDVVNPEDYFNSGVILMNLKVLRAEQDTILAGMKFISEHPQFILLDQDILNYCFSTVYLKLPLKFNRMVFFARSENELSVEKKIYHYADLKATLGLYVNDPFSRLFFDYFIKTPWVDDDTRVALSGSLPSRKNYSVSVVIPMYNAAEFIRECLDSLLIQTFRDFEVIVVDDCSTDLSCEIVKSYIPKFNGRLKLTNTEKNSGTDCVPRNIGMMLARGEYILFIDSDDMILATALETLYKAAILYDADVVYTSQHYIWEGPNEVVLYKDGTSRKLHVNTDLTVDEPTTNLNRLLLEPGEGNFHAAWTKFVRRDFMLRDNIFFADLPLAGDFVGVINIYCHARRFLRISTPLYFYKTYNDHAMSRKARAPQEQVRHWFSSFVKFNEALHELEKKNEVLAANPLYCLEASKKTFAWTLHRTEDARKELGNDEIYKALHSSFDKTSSDSSAVLLPSLFRCINEKSSNDYYVKTVNKFKRHLTARADIKLVPKDEGGDFQIVSVSDDRATLWKPDWFQKGGVGYQIQSYKGDMEIIAKATSDGKFTLNLRGIWVPDPKDRNKRIPYWIDYTKLAVNEKVIFDKLKPVWHDKPFNYGLDVKAGEEVKIQMEWQPHIETIKPVAGKFLPYLTARLDAKLTTTAGGDFKILSVSDDRATLWKPDWFQKGGVGYQIQSYKGDMEIIAKATSDGKFTLNLRGIWVPDPKDRNKRIPYWIDYTKLAVNEKVIFDKLKPVWHDKPFNYGLDVKAGEEVKIQMEWQPHRSDA